MNNFVAAIEGLYPGYEVLDVRFMLQSGASLDGNMCEIDQLFADAVKASVEIDADDLVTA